MKFLCRLLSGNGEAAIYVEPKTSDVKSGTRLITDKITTTGELVTYKLTPIVPQEKIIFDMIRRGKVWYSDNTTAHDFSVALDKYGFIKEW